MADNICPRADPERSPLNFLVSSMRPSMTSADTSVFGNGCRLTSDLPVALFMGVSSLSLGRFEMRVFDDAEHIAPGIEHVRDADALAHVRDLGMRLGAELEQSCVRAGDVLDAPVDARRAGGGIGHQAELVAADIEADVERLVEIRGEVQRFRIPTLALGQIRGAVNGGAQT